MSDHRLSSRWALSRLVFTLGLLALDNGPGGSDRIEADAGSPPADLAATRAELAAVRAELDALREDQHRLIGRMSQAVEEERSRLASDLHNRPLQELAGVGYQLERVSMALSRGDIDAADTMVNEAADELTRQLEAIRMIMTDLRSPALAERGLAGALASVKARFQHECPEISITMDGLDLPMAVETETVFYRVVQESLNNVARHANASTVTVQIGGSASHAELVVQDNGAGFDVAAQSAAGGTHHNGINAMRERLSMINGTLAMESSDNGTTVRCSAPRSFAEPTQDQGQVPQ